MEDLDSKHEEKHDHANCLGGITSSDFSVVAAEERKPLDYSLSSYTIHSNANASCDSDRNASEPNNYSNAVISNKCESHSVFSVIEKQCGSSVVEGGVSCCSVQSIKSHVPQEAVKIIAPAANTQQGATLKSIDCVDTASQESEICEELENHALVCPGNDTDVSEITKELKSIATTDIQTEQNITACILCKHKTAAGCHASLNCMHYSENLKVVMSSSHEETLSERQGGHTLKLIEEIHEGPIDMGKDERVAKITSIEERNSCNTTEVNNCHNSTNPVDEYSMDTHVSQESCRGLQHGNVPANVGQLSELHSCNDAMNSSEAQANRAGVENNFRKSWDILDFSVLPTSKVCDKEESSKQISEDIKKELLNSHSEESDDDIRQSSAFWAHEPHTSNMLPSSKTTKISAIFRNTVMFELD